MAARLMRARRRLVRAPRWAALRRGFLGLHDPIGKIAALTGFGLLAIMLLRVALAWRSGLL